MPNTELVINPNYRKLLRLDQYFGIWGILPAVGDALFARAQNEDWEKHITLMQMQASMPRDDDEEEDDDDFRAFAGIRRIDVSGTITKYGTSFDQGSSSTIALRRQLRDEDLTGRLLSDGVLAVEEFHLELARALRHAGPWGQHFPEPLFHGVFQLVEQRVVGERHLKVVLRSECGSVKLDGIAFGIDREVWPNPTIKWVELAYKLDVNEFRGNETVQLMIAHIEPR